jgi:hypothetical protein
VRRYHATKNAAFIDTSAVHQTREIHTRVTDDAEAAQHWRETLVTHAGRDLVISLVWPVET